MKKQGLGRGASTLLGVNESGARDAVEVELLPAERIVANPCQPRRAFDDETLRELADSIRDHGMLQPIVVRRGRDAYEVIAGERRLRAARLAGLKRVPAIIRDCTDDEALAVALIENLQREDLSPLEAAGAYRRLQEEFGLTQEEIAARVGKSRSAVANALRLLQLDPQVQERLKTGAITEGHARALLSLENPERQREVCEQLIRERASVRDAERWVRETRTPLPDAESEATGRRGPASPPGVGEEPSGARPARRRPALDPNLAEVEAALRAHFGTRVTITRGRSRGTIALEFYSDEDLDRLARLMLGESG